MEQYEFHKKIRSIGLIIAMIPILIVLFGILKHTISDLDKKTETIQTEGKVVECTTVENTNIFSLVGLNDNLEYRTIIEVDNKILESRNKEIYYLCKDKVNSSVNFKIETYDGEASKIKKVLNS
ncbi:hypothetical protein FDC58_14910 [Clostridium botulinum]|uniref:Uncharacterized protein n=1 Tax=Clostridium botulinum TaxID=1491 RepID=A0A0A0V029_CLOBO|nr:hypothetical protein [Clostridium botulinum]AIW54623.1 hypothetical protein [Clostridium botulinum]AIW54742.1 hypothetical protein [Clostridium botulinum]AIW54811.1 hypothetical protein [Clostridium botulinum]AIW54872.1 hypothetical protein [Clostridium botulinum]MBY7009313.1 hypothetical protein [Clostridium botulinum]